MFIGLSPEQEALRRELRAYYAKLLTPEVREMLVREHGVGPGTKQIRMPMAKDGWFCFGWPVEYGGRGASEIDHFIFFDFGDVHTCLVLPCQPSHGHARRVCPPSHCLV
jgi:hypothetical protein